MFTQQGPGSIFYSAVAAEPEMHPLIEGALSLTPYAAGLAGMHYLMRSPYGGDADAKYTKYDILQSQIRNIANKTPFGFGNTFRIPEFMSPYASPEALGLNKGLSILDGTETYSHTWSADVLRTESTRKAIKEMIGDPAYSKMSTFLSPEDNKFQLVYEQKAGQRGQGRLIFQQLE
ncbi:hypothetical protein CMI37_33980, partial [Candidatus Pacearchaeota archaeon]|nr:hypothetical protein [Candidatus Pacearchaeota archaeon]